MRKKGGIGAKGDLKGSPGDVDWNASDRRTDGMQAGHGAERLPVAGDRSTRKDEPRGIPAGGCNAVEQAMALTGEIETYVRSFTHPVLGASTAQVTQISGRRGAKYDAGHLPDSHGYPYDTGTDEPDGSRSGGGVCGGAFRYIRRKFRVSCGLSMTGGRSRLENPIRL